MPTYKLTYFNARGRAEIVRLVFAAAGVDYEDHRIEKADWPALKPNTPFGQIPVLDVDGVQLCQSNASARLLAKKYHLAGKTDLEQLRADMIIDCVDDMVKPVRTFMFEQDETRKAALKKRFGEDDLPRFLTGLETLLKENTSGDGYFVGDGLTWADLAVFIAVSGLLLGDEASQLDKYPKLKAHHQRVETQPKIAAWIAERPQTQF